MDEAMITHSIKSFEEVLKRYGFIKKELNQNQIEMIKEKIEEHEKCHESWINNEYADGEEMLEVTVYAGGENVALECASCNSIVIDSEYFLRH